MALQGQTTLRSQQVSPARTLDNFLHRGPRHFAPLPLTDPRLKITWSHWLTAAWVSCGRQHCNSCHWFPHFGSTCNCVRGGQCQDRLLSAEFAAPVLAHMWHCSFEAHMCACISRAAGSKLRAGKEGSIHIYQTTEAPPGILTKSADEKLCTKLAMVCCMQC